MMQVFRNSAKPLIYVVTIAFFGWLVLDLSGLSGGTGILTKTSVGKINGHTIDARIFQQAVQDAVQQEQRTGAVGIEGSAAVRDRVWDQFIQSTILQDEYERRGIRASVQEVAQAIQNSPPVEFEQDPKLAAQFQTDGKFDITKYQRFLASASGRSIIPALEARYQDEIMRGKLLRGVIADVYPSDAALWERYRDEKETVKLAMATVYPATSVPDSAVKVTNEEAEVYYRAHRDDFKRPAGAFLSYVPLSRVAWASDSAAALAKAVAVREEIAKGAAFEEVAKRESSDTVSGNRGGSLGEWAKGQFDPKFETAAAALALNQVSAPVLTRFGYHLIEVTLRKGDKTTGRHILIPIEVTGAHRERLDAQADTLEKLGAEQLDPAAIDTVSRALGIPIQHTGAVIEGTRVAAGGAMVPDAGVWAFQAKVGEHSPVIETPNAYFLFRLDSLQTAGIPEFKSIQADVETIVRTSKKKVLAKRLAEDILKQVAGGMALEAATKSHGSMGTNYSEPGPFTRLDPPVRTPAVIGAAFGLEVGQRSGPIDAEDGIYLIQVLQHTKADSSEFTKNLDQLRTRQLQVLRQNRAREYFAALRSAAKIVDNRAQIYRTGAQANASNPTPRP